MNPDEMGILDDLRWMNPPSEGFLLPWWAWVLAAAVLLLAVFLMARRWKKGKSVLPFLAPPPPHTKAFQELKDHEMLIHEGRVKEFTERVSLTVRNYIQERFGLRAPHRSTEEFLWEASKESALNGDERQLLEFFLTRSDVVKFAGRRTEVQEAERLLRAARRFVKETMAPENGDAQSGGGK